MSSSSDDTELGVSGIRLSRSEHSVMVAGDGGRPGGVRSSYTNTLWLPLSVFMVD